MPLEVCKYSRSSRTKICQENTETSPSFGYCAAQKLRYLGYNIHAVFTVQGVIEPPIYQKLRFTTLTTLTM